MGVVMIFCVVCFNGGVINVEEKEGVTESLNREYFGEFVTEDSKPLSEILTKEYGA